MSTAASRRLRTHESALTEISSITDVVPLNMRSRFQHAVECSACLRHHQAQAGEGRKQ
jgi:hypothetical protein